MPRSPAARAADEARRAAAAAICEPRLLYTPTAVAADLEAASRETADPDRGRGKRPAESVEQWPACHPSPRTSPRG